MTASALWWLFCNLLSLVFLAFYSMMEMACVSFNKVRLHYYVSKGNPRALWLNALLQHPFRLFGTTLIGVNVSMFLGSECARKFHAALGLNPDLAPLSQVIIVILFGELAPMFAARHYPEYIAMKGAPLVYFSSKLLSPALKLVEWISHLVNLVTRGKAQQPEIFLSKEELEKIVEEQGDAQPAGDSEEFNIISRNIFSLRHKKAKEALTPLAEIPKLPSNATISQMRTLIRQTNGNFTLIYYKDPSNVVGIAFPRDLIRFPGNKRVRDYASAPWFVTENTPITEIMQQFQKNNESVAVTLDKNGRAKGILTLEDSLTEIFGESRYTQAKEKNIFFMERSFPGTSTVGEFNKQFGLVLDPDAHLTLSDLMKKILGRHPEEGDSVYIDPLELTAKETSLLEVKTVTIKSRS